MAMSNQYTLYHLHSDLSNGVTNIDSVTKYGEYIRQRNQLTLCCSKLTCVSGKSKTVSSVATVVVQFQVA